MAGVAVVPSSAQFFMPFEYPLIGEEAPDFTLDVLGRKKVNFTEYRDGQKAIIFFWATWCPHCRTQLIEMSEHKEVFDRQGIKIVFVDLGEKDRVVARFVKKYGIQYPIFLDKKGELEEPYQIMGLPTFFFVNTDGDITAIQHSLPEDYLDVLNHKM